MKRALLAFVVLVAFVTLASSEQEDDVYNDVAMKVGSVQEINISPGKQTRLVLDKTPEVAPAGSNETEPVVAFFVFEVHTHAVGVRFSETPFTGPESALEEKVRFDHGLVILNDPKSDQICAFIDNDKEVDVRGLVLVRGYSDMAPVPGLGTKSKLPIDKVRPELWVEWDEFITAVTFKASGSLEPATTTATAAAASSATTSLSSDTLVFKYEVYRYWMKEGDFSRENYIEGVSNMLFKKDIEVNGHLVESQYLKKNEVSELITVQFPSFPGTATIFAVIVTATSETPSGEKTFHSVYASGMTTGCYMKVTYPEAASAAGNNGTDGDDDGSDDVIIDDDEDDDEPSDQYAKWHCKCVYFTETQVVMASCVFIGIFLTAFGHRAFAAAQGIFGMFFVGTVTYPIAAGIIDLDHLSALLCVIGCGILGGVAAYFLWNAVGVPLVSASVPNLLTGSLLAMIVIHIANSVQSEAMMQPLIYYGTAGAVTGVYFFVTISFTKVAHLLSCAIVGGFTLAIALDHYVGASIKFILLNFLRRLFVDDYGLVCCQLPFQDNEKMIVILWSVVSVLSFSFQFWRERNRPPFPTHSSSSHNPVANRLSQRSPTVINIAPVNSDDDDERSPLIPPPPPGADQARPVPSAPPAASAAAASAAAAAVAAAAAARGATVVEPVTHRGRIVGYIQGYGAVTSPTRSPLMRVYQDPLFYVDRDIRMAPSSRHHHHLRSSQHRMQEAPPNVQSSNNEAAAAAAVAAAAAQQLQREYPTTIGGGGPGSGGGGPGGGGGCRLQTSSSSVAAERSRPKDIFRPPDMDSQVSQS